MEDQIAQNSLWNEFTLKGSDKDILIAFAKDIFSSLSISHPQYEKVIESEVVTSFLGVPFPIGERIFKCVKHIENADVLQLHEFIDLICLFYVESPSNKAEFFFRLLDFNEDNTIQLDDTLLFFYHLNYDNKICHEKDKELINTFFNKKNIMTYDEYKKKNVQNNDVIMIFYYYVSQMKTFNGEVLNYYLDNIMVLKLQCHATRKIKSLQCLSQIALENECISQLKTRSREDNLKIAQSEENEKLKQEENSCEDKDEDDEFESLNKFENDKKQSFELYNSYESIRRLSQDTTCSNIPISIDKKTDSNQSSSSYILETNPKEVSPIKVQSNSNKKPFPYRLNTSSHKQKIGYRSAKIDISDHLFKINCFNNNNNNNDLSSLIDFPNVTNSSYIGVRLVIVHNYLFVLNNENPLKYQIILLKNSFLMKITDTSLAIYPSLGKEYKYTFPSKSKLDMFIQVFEELNKYKSFDDKYDIIEEISRGKFGKITLIKMKSEPKKVYCLKTVYKHDTVSKHSQWETYIAKFLSVNPHPNIIQFYSVYESLKRIQILMEYSSISTLENAIGNISKADTEKIMKDITEAINYLHTNGIIHRDLKIDNILFNQKELKIKIIDFGLSKVLFSSEKTKEFCGTLSYIAPEIIQKEDYSFKADIWSLGVIAHLLEYQQYPYQITGLKFEQIYFEVSSFLKALSSESNSNWNDSILKRIIMNTLLEVPEERKSIIELLNFFSLH